VTYFFDNCISSKIARIIKDTRRSDVVHLSDEFPRVQYPNGVPDPVWIPVVGEREWVVVSGDLRILRNPAHRRTLEKANVVAYQCREA